MVPLIDLRTAEAIGGDQFVDNAHTANRPYVLDGIGSRLKPEDDCQ